MQRGPKPADFEAAMAAQQAPPKNPPRKIADGIHDPAHDEKSLKWTSVQRTAWDQQGRDVDVYVCADTFVTASMILCAPVCCGVGVGTPDVSERVSKTGAARWMLFGLSCVRALARRLC